MTKDEALKLALEALQEVFWSARSEKHDEAITAIKEALAQPEQEPVAAQCKFDTESRWLPCEIEFHNLVQSEPHKWPEYQTRLLYTTPPKPKQEQEPVAYREAAQLAKWLFKTHYSQEEHYASGRIVWGLSDTTVGIIYQIDNMVCKLVLPKETEQEPVAKNEEGRIIWLVDNWPQNCLLYTTPTQRKPLTEEQTIIFKGTTCPEIDWAARHGVEMNNGEYNKWLLDWFMAFKVAIEAAHGIKGEA